MAEGSEEEGRDLTCTLAHPPLTYFSTDPTTAITTPPLDNEEKRMKWGEGIFCRDVEAKGPGGGKVGGNGVMTYLAQI